MSCLFIVLNHHICLIKGLTFSLKNLGKYIRAQLPLGFLQSYCFMTSNYWLEWVKKIKKDGIVGSSLLFVSFVGKNWHQIPAIELWKCLSVFYVFSLKLISVCVFAFSGFDERIEVPDFIATLEFTGFTAKQLISWELKSKRNKMIQNLK